MSDFDERRVGRAVPLAVQALAIDAAREAGVIGPCEHANRALVLRCRLRRLRLRPAEWLAARERAAAECGSSVANTLEAIKGACHAG